MKPQQKTLSVIFSFVGWFAMITQFILILNNRAAPITETIVRFLSFFTILTNILAALFFTSQSIGKKRIKAGTLTAITTYITVVGLVYQVLLRRTYMNTGITFLYRQIATWLLFPFIYLVFILIKGYFSVFYPYPFINISLLGFPNVMLNAFGLLLLFISISGLFVFIGRKLNH